MQLRKECNREEKDADYCRRCSAADGLVVREDELTGGVGGARPAVCEPRPNFCNVFASSFPEGLRPWDSWNFFMAPTVESSHLPLGLPAKEPSFARAD